MPHPNAVHILMQIKDQWNISYLFLAAFSSETTDFVLTPRQVSKEWNGWWPCFPKGFMYLAFWCLFDLNIYPSFETLGGQRLLNCLLYLKRRVHKYLSSPFPSGCPENIILTLQQQKMDCQVSLVSLLVIPWGLLNKVSTPIWSFIAGSHFTLNQCRVGNFSCFCTQPVKGSFTKWLSKIYEDLHGREAERKFNYIQLLVISMSEDVPIYCHLKNHLRK